MQKLRVGMIGAGISSLSAYIFMAVSTYLIVRKWMKVPYEWFNLTVMFVLTLGLTLLYYLFQVEAAWLKLLMVTVYAVIILFFIYPRKQGKIGAKPTA